MKRQTFLPTIIASTLLFIAISIQQSSAQQKTVYTENPTAAWLFWDDFESGDFSRYTVFNRGGKNGPNQFAPAPGIGLGGSQGMRAEFREADGKDYGTGWLQVYFGVVPEGYFKSVAAKDEYLTEIYARFYFKCDENWDFGGADKLSRITSIQGRDHSQSMIAHLWSGGEGHKYLRLDPASGIDITGGNAQSRRNGAIPMTNSKLISTKYNDFPNLSWNLIRTGERQIDIPFFDKDHVGKWYCIEMRVKLNDPGVSNGIFQVWVDDVLKSSHTNLNWIGKCEVGPGKLNGINAFYLENYCNNGVKGTQVRYFDNLVISREKIGMATLSAPNAFNYWTNSLEAIEKAALGVKQGKSSVLAKSPGGRSVYLVEYGDKQDLKRQTNYNASLYYRDPKVYADRSNAKPVVLIVGGSHGGEIEGMTAVLNLIAALETGKDLRGKTHDWITDLAKKYRLLLIPCLNPDGRARVPHEFNPEEPARTAFYKHGLWLDGTPITWNGGMKVHPILGATSHMGGYFNDDGVNPAADNYFSFMSPENVALFKLLDLESPDLTVILHTGCHKHGKLLEPYYMPGFISKFITEFDDKLLKAFECAGYTYYSLREHLGYAGGATNIHNDIWPPPPLPMEAAVTFACGGMGVVYESREAVIAPDNPFFLENILNCHFILFEQSLLQAREFQQKSLEAAAASEYERSRKRSF